MGKISYPFLPLFAGVEVLLQRVSANIHWLSHQIFYWNSTAPKVSHALLNEYQWCLIRVSSFMYFVPKSGTIAGMSWRLI